jgi:hypothetical protein
MEAECEGGIVSTIFKIQQIFANPQVTDTKEYWRITLYYQFVDHLLKDLRDHMVKSEDRFLA